MNMRNKETKYSYPSQEELALHVLKLSPCSLSDILRDLKIVITGATLEAVKRRLRILEANNGVIIKHYPRIWIIYSPIFEDAKRKELTKRLAALGVMNNVSI